MPTKMELQAKIDKLESNGSITYEGLASLIVQQGINDKEWRDEFKTQFTESRKENKEDHEKLEKYNSKQNGRQADMMKEIVDLKRESNDRKLTCGTAVEVLMKAKEKAEQEAVDNGKDKKKITRLNIQWAIMALIALGSMMAFIFG